MADDETKAAALDDEEREALERVRDRAAPKVRDGRQLPQPLHPDDPTAEDELPPIRQGAGPGVFLGEVGT